MASTICPSCLRTSIRHARIASSKPQPTLFRNQRGFITTPRPQRAAPPTKPAAGRAQPTAEQRSTDTVKTARAAASATASQPKTPLEKIADVDDTADFDVATMQARLREQLSVKPRSTLSSVASTYAVYGVAEKLYEICGKQVTYRIKRSEDEEEQVRTMADGEEVGEGKGWWIEDLGLPATFSTWSQVTMLHVYLLTARTRCFEAAEASEWQKYLIEHFFQDVEKMMIMNHNMQSRSVRNKYLKDVFLQWRGIIAAYDEGIARGDAALASAVWRNLFRGREDVDVKNLAVVVSYMRRVLKKLDGVSQQDLMEGKIGFGSPKSEWDLVNLRSGMFNESFIESREAPAKA